MSIGPVKWSIEADYFQCCNCDYGCPCEFEAPPTQGYCEGAGAYLINTGRYGDVSLDGLGFAWAATWPGAIHLGGGTGALMIDERASQRQREALVNIASGAAGGMPFEIMATTLSKVLDPAYLPFSFYINGRDSSVTIGSEVSMAFEPIKNPVTGGPEVVRIQHESGFIFKDAEVVSAKEGKVSIGELTFSWPNKSGFVTKITYRN